MPKKTAPKKDNQILIQVLIIVALAAIALFVMTVKSTLPQTPATPVDIESTPTELDNVNLDQIDSGLNQLNTESTSF